MLRWAKRRPFFRSVHVAFLERRLPLYAHFVSPFASKASRHDASPGASKSRNHGSACVSGSEVCRQHAHHPTRDAKLSVHNAGRQDVDVQFCNDDDKSHPVDGDAIVFEFAACMPHAKTCFNNGDVSGAESVASLIDEGTAPNCKVKGLASEVSNASCETQSLHVSSQTLFEQRQTETQQRAASDLQEKIELLKSEQFSLSETTTLLKARSFKACSVEQLARVLQELKQIFPCVREMHGILVKTPKVLLQPAELVQQKLKILNDFQVKKEIVSKLCGSGRVLSVSAELLQERLMFYERIGLTVDARNMMLARGPLMLLHSIENHIQPKLKLMENSGLTKESICKMFQCCPEAFYVSVDNVIKKFEYFRQLGFSANDLPKVCYCLRRISIERMEKHLQSLKDLGFTHDDVLLMIKKQPAILAHGPDSLKCKLDFLIHEQKRDMAEIVHSPCCLMYSLQSRIVPRFRVVKEFGSSKVFSLSYILDVTDSTFKEQFTK